MTNSEEEEIYLQNLNFHNSRNFLFPNEDDNKISGKHESKKNSDFERQNIYKPKVKKQKK